MYWVDHTIHGFPVGSRLTSTPVHHWGGGFMALRAGERLGPYEILGGLGAGGWANEATATVTQETDPATVMGTAGYMSPEQVRGEAADPRSDLFALGAVLYELLTGRRAFHKDTSVGTLNAILTEEPPELPADARVPTPLDRLVRHCLEKKPEDRFQSARDLAYELEGLAGS